MSQRRGRRVAGALLPEITWQRNLAVVALAQGCYLETRAANKAGASSRVRVKVPSRCADARQEQRPLLSDGAGSQWSGQLCV